MEERLTQQQIQGLGLDDRQLLPEFIGYGSTYQRAGNTNAHEAVFADLAAAVLAAAKIDSRWLIIYQHTYGRYAEVDAGCASVVEMNAAAKEAGQPTAAERHTGQESR